MRRVGPAVTQHIGAIAAGLPVLGLARRPTDVGTLQAIAAVGQPRLMERLGALLGEHRLIAGQVLLTPHDFGVRSQYLHARETLRRLLDLGVVPVVNENDTVADDEIRYGDNDRLAALVSHLVGADVLVLLTDTPGLYTTDPRLDERFRPGAESAAVDAGVATLEHRGEVLFAAPPDSFAGKAPDAGAFEAGR